RGRRSECADGAPLSIPTSSSTTMAPLPCLPAKRHGLVARPGSVACLRLDGDHLNAGIAQRLELLLRRPGVGDEGADPLETRDDHRGALAELAAVGEHDELLGAA